jgi:hypothetical protein
VDNDLPETPPFEIVKWAGESFLGPDSNRQSLKRKMTDRQMSKEGQRDETWDQAEHSDGSVCIAPQENH